MNKGIRKRLGLPSLSVLSAFGVLVIGCSAPDHDGDGVKQVQNEVVNGDPLYPYSPENSGIVFIEPNMGTGVLITNQWVLTVAHNLGRNAFVDPTRITVSMGGYVPGSTQPVTNRQVRHGVQAIFHPDLERSSLIFTADAEPVDLALLRVDQPFDITGENFRLFQGDTSQLSGKTCWVFGYGPGDESGGGLGVLRYGFLPVKGLDPNSKLKFIAGPGVDGSGQPVYTRQGDSGSPCFINGTIAGIFREFDDSNNSYFLRAELFRDWVQRVLFTKGATDITKDHSADLVIRSYDASSATVGENKAWSIQHEFLDPGDGGSPLGTTDTLSVSRESSLPTIADTGWRILGSGDFNKDGRMDFVLRYFGDPTATSSAVYFWLTNDALGSFVSPGSVDKSWEIKAVADIDQDGVSDLVWQFQRTPNYAIWAIQPLSASSLSYQIVRGGAPLAAEPDSGWDLIGAADFDHYQNLSDGSVRVDARPLAPDLLFRNVSTGDLELRRMVWANGGYVRYPNPDAVLFAPDQTDHGTTQTANQLAKWQLVSVADFNNDGFADLAWQCVDQTPCGSDYNRVVVWARQGFEAFASDGSDNPTDHFAFTPLPFRCLGADPCTVPSPGGWQGVAPH